MNAFDCAITMEVESRKYYEKLAAESVLPELKNLFTVLAAAEQEHYDALLVLKEKGGQAGTRFAALQEVACLVPPLLAKRDLLAELQEDTDAYKHVLKDKTAAAKYYEEMAAQEQDERIREVLLLLAAEEQRHLNIVENIYSFVESPKNYLAWGEFSNLKEY